MRILYILLALVILMILITAHEFGHYLAGKIFKFKINEFSIGFGPAIYKKTKKDGEVFSIRALPLGGYCAFEGEDQEETEKSENQEEQNSWNSDESKPLKDNSEETTTEVQPEVYRGKKFNEQPAWKRLIVLFGGVLFNFLFGIITSAIYLMVAGYGVPVVSATRNMQLQSGDKIVAVNHQSIEAYRPFDDLKTKNKMVLTVVRGGEKLDIEIEYINTEFFAVDGNNKKTNELLKNLYVKDGEEYKKVTNFAEFYSDVLNANILIEDEQKYPDLPENKYYQLNSETNTYELYNAKDLVSNGVFKLNAANASYGFVYGLTIEKYGFFECLLKAWPFGFYICKVILGALGGIFTGATKISDLGGTITTISTIATYSAMNPLIILYLFPMLSFNLAIFNILPIPALDGARMVFVLWEMITRKPVNRKVEGYIHTIGLFVLLALVIFLDVYHLFV